MQAIDLVLVLEAILLKRSNCQNLLIGRRHAPGAHDVKGQNPPPSKTAGMRTENKVGPQGPEGMRNGN